MLLHPYLDWSHHKIMIDNVSSVTEESTVAFNDKDRKEWDGDCKPTATQSKSRNEESQ